MLQDDGAEVLMRAADDPGADAGIQAPGELQHKPHELQLHCRKRWETLETPSLEGERHAAAAAAAAPREEALGGQLDALLHEIRKLRRDKRTPAFAERSTGDAGVYAMDVETLGALRRPSYDLVALEPHAKRRDADDERVWVQMYELQTNEKINRLRTEQLNNKLAHLDSLRRRERAEAERLRRALQDFKRREDFMREQNQSLANQVARLESLKEKLKGDIKSLESQVMLAELFMLGKDGPAGDAGARHQRRPPPPAARPGCATPTREELLRAVSCGSEASEASEGPAAARRTPPVAPRRPGSPAPKGPWFGRHANKLVAAAGVSALLVAVGAAVQRHAGKPLPS